MLTLISLKTETDLGIAERLLSRSKLLIDNGKYDESYENSIEAKNLIVNTINNYNKSKKLISNINKNLKIIVEKEIAIEPKQIFNEILSLELV